MIYTEADITSTGRWELFNGEHMKRVWYYKKDSTSFEAGGIHSPVDSARSELGVISLGPFVRYVPNCHLSFKTRRYCARAYGRSARLGAYLQPFSFVSIPNPHDDPKTRPDWVLDYFWKDSAFKQFDKHPTRLRSISTQKDLPGNDFVSGRRISLTTYAKYLTLNPQYEDKQLAAATTIAYIAFIDILKSCPSVNEIDTFWFDTQIVEEFGEETVQPRDPQKVEEFAKTKSVHPIVDIGRVFGDWRVRVSIVWGGKKYIPDDLGECGENAIVFLEHEGGWGRKPTKMLAEGEWNVYISDMWVKYEGEWCRVSPLSILFPIWFPEKEFVYRCVWSMNLAQWRERYVQALYMFGTAFDDTGKAFDIKPFVWYETSWEYWKEYWESYPRVYDTRGEYTYTGYTRLCGTWRNTSCPQKTFNSLRRREGSDRSWYRLTKTTNLGW